jgi:hypothetical protein
MKSKKENNEQEEITIKVKKGSPDEVRLQQKGATYQVYEDEVNETQDDDPLNPYGSGETTQQPHQVGPSTNDGFGAEKQTPGMYQDGMDEGESEESDKNPWAICTSSLGLEGRERDSYSKAESAKFERCVRDVKKSVKEGQSPYQPILEMQLESLIKKHLPSRITKGEFIETLSEQGIVRKKLHKSPVSDIVSSTPMDKPIGKMYTLTKKEAMEQGTTTAPTRVKPGTKEKPGTNDPFKNPKHKPKPKAKKSDSVVKIPDYITFDQLKFNFDEK